MARHERLYVDSAAVRLGITPDAVRSRIKRGTLRAVRHNGRVQVVLRDPIDAGFARTPIASQSADGRDMATEIVHQKHRVRELERELVRLRRFLDMEQGLRSRLQDQIDCLNQRLLEALPEILDDPVKRIDHLWKRLGRQVERLGG